MNAKAKPVNFALINEEIEPLHSQGVRRKVQTTLTRQDQKTETVSKFKQEADSWRSFSQSLRYEDRETFRQMMTKVWKYSEAIENSGRGYTTEALLLSLILSQHKTIVWLSKQIEKLKESEERLGI